MINLMSTASRFAVYNMYKCTTLHYSKYIVEGFQRVEISSSR